MLSHEKSSMYGWNSFWVKQKWVDTGICVFMCIEHREGNARNCKMEVLQRVGRKVWIREASCTWFTSDNLINDLNFTMIVYFFRKTR